MKKDWDDWTDNEEEAICLFCDKKDIPTNIFSHMTSEHNFNFTKLRIREKMDFYECIKLLNYIRRNVKENPAFTMDTNITKTELKSILEDDINLQPVLMDDALLYEMELIKKLQDTEEKLKKMEQAFNEYKQVVQKTFLDKLENNDNLELPELEDNENKKENESESESDHEYIDSDLENGDYYFTSYANTDIHIQMLQDSVRTSSYRDFFYNNKSFFKGKTVLDVGCGTGILSMFAAKAGAKKVYSVDNSSIIAKARKNVKENGLDDIITLYYGQVEDIVLPEKVDVIVSEWMGYFLLFEGMLDSVIKARDKWLVEGGLMAPSDTSIILSLIENEDWINSYYNYWNDVYGFKMTSMKKEYILDGQVAVLKPESIISDEVKVKSWDLNKASIEDLSFTSEFKFTCSKNARVHGICGYFDITFRNPKESTFEDVYFSTSLLCKPTHWKQCTFILENAFNVQQGEIIQGTITVTRLKRNHRDLKVDLSLSRASSNEILLDKVRYFVR
ncbi:S-adenosyl-L-methionine-dependent methyltransferase [Anaeromyces robustus]|uniref:type I protein arginine methyltransferase n=1 Tax=Anaeromyces robustus TaxID=1754192 RepID=A0A1Y1VW34_9FUNG|nr:S-adenosyl-L-methionine-dependent methyltransferase [Anaeromyces robustus]|eukprot:ORX65500.1 S-adenosyl-L-methionine-dependent methyltransferase [Anaeromyces robustus]